MPFLFKSLKVIPLFSHIHYLLVSITFLLISSSFLNIPPFLSSIYSNVPCVRTSESTILKTSPPPFLHSFLSSSLSVNSECVALQDPYCAWDKIQGKCRAHNGGKEDNFYQSVATGTHTACPPPKAGKDAGSVGGLSDRSTQPKFNQDHQSGKDRPEGQVINIVQDKEYQSNGK